MTYLIFAVLVVIIFQCVIKRNGSPDSKPETDSADIPAESPEEEIQGPEIIEKKKKSKKGGMLPVIYICMIVLLCGLTLIGGAYKSVNESEKITSQGHQATAYITRVYEYEVYDNDGNISDARDIYIKYEINGVSYKNVIKKAYMYASEHDIGKPVEIYYDGNDPNIISVPDDVKSKVSVKLPLGIVISAIPIVAFLFFTIKYFAQKKPQTENQESDF